MASTSKSFVAFLLLFGILSAAIVGVGETLPVSYSGSTADEAPAGAQAGPSENGTSGAVPSVVSVGEATDTGENTGSGTAPGSAGAGGSPSAAQVSAEAQPAGGRGNFVLTTTSGEPVQAWTEIEAVQASPGRIEVMAREGNAFVSASEALEGEEPTEVDAEVSPLLTAEALRLRIQAREQEMLLQMGNVSVSTSETVRIRERTMYLERNGTEYAVSVLPSDLPRPESADASLENITLTFEGEQPAYRFTVRERRNFLWLFPLDSERAFTLNAQNAQVIREEGPWWAFMAPPLEDLRPALDELSVRIAGAGNN